MRKELMNFSMQEPGVRVLLPVAQEYDKDPDLRQGQCFGLTTYLITCLARGKAPFGMRPDLPIPFQYEPSLEWTQGDLKLNPDELELRKQMYDLNHLGRITEEIKKYQTYEYEHDLSKFDKDFTIKQCGFGVGNTPEELAKKLCGLAKKNPGVGLNISLNIPNLGYHSVGIRRRRDNKIDFFDANHGWFEFENENVFVKWSSEWAKSYNLKTPLPHAFIYEATAFYHNAASSLKAKIKINNARVKAMIFLRDFIVNALAFAVSKFSKDIFKPKPVDEKKIFSQPVIAVAAENKKPKIRKFDPKAHRYLQALGIDVSLKAEKHLKKDKQTSEMATRSKDDSDTRTKQKEFKLPFQAPKLESHDYKNKQLSEESKQPSEEKHAGLTSSPKARH